MVEELIRGQECDKVLLAAYEAERQEAVEKAERYRIARQRDCTMGMESHNMGVMVQAPCSQWYCQDDIRGKTLIS